VFRNPCRKFFPYQLIIVKEYMATRSLEKLNSLLGRIKMVVGNKSPDVIGVQIEEGTLQIVHGKESGEGIIVEHIFEKKYPKDNDEELAEILKETLSNFKVKQLSKFVFILPTTAFISKNVDVPSKEEEEIRKIVELQANRNTPYSREELVVDYLCMDTPKEHYTNVLLIIVNRAVIQKYFKILSDAGIEAERVTIAQEGMGNSYYELGQINANGDAIGGIHISGDSSNLTVFEKKQATFVRSIPVGGRQLRVKKEEALLDFLRELNKSMVAYQNQRTGKPLKSVVVTGSIKELDFLKEEMRQSIPFLFASNIPIQMVSYEKKFRFSDTTQHNLEANTDTSFFEIISCLAVRSKLKLDLTPKEIKLKRRFRERGQNIITMGITIMALFLMISVFLVTKIYLKRAYLDKLNALHQSTHEKALTLEETSTQSRFLRSFLQERGKSLFIFEKVTNLVDNDVYLSNLAVDGEGVIKLKGTAESLSRVFNFVTDLENSGYLADVTTNQTKSRKQGGRDVADFEIECKFIDEYKAEK
jgi:Tfp pilus assembly PilM family ATPase/Tfp pilus assembly protein PilN